MPGVRVEGLSKRFGDIVAVNGVTTAIRPGELFTLLGPSGCGKTTLLRLLAGLETPEAGAVWFGKQRVERLAAHERNIGMVFQNYAIFPHMSVFDNVAYGLRARKVPEPKVRERVAESLALVDMAGYAARRPDQLSGGQQQRVALARALAPRPALLLMDEPLSNLDARLRLQMRSEIRNLQRQVSITTVYVTHDQEEALAISDRIGVMEEGRLIQVGTPAEIYGAPASRQVAAFVGACSFLSGQSVPGFGADAVVGLRPEKVRLRPAGAGPAEIALPGTVAEETFLGSFVSIQVRLGTGELVGALSLEPAGTFVPGQAVEVSFARPAALVFDAATGEAIR